MDVVTEGQGDWRRLRLSGEIDLATAPRLRQALDAAMAEGARRIDVDLAGVRFLDSSGLGAILATYRRLGEGGRMRLLAPQPAVLTVLKLSGVLELMEVAPAEAEADG